MSPTQPKAAPRPDDVVPAAQLAGELGVNVGDLVLWFKLGLITLGMQGGQWVVAVREVNALRERIANGTQQRLPIIR